MHSLRRHRLCTVFVALISLLFMQWAVAAYSCPGAPEAAAAQAPVQHAGMHCAQATDPAMDTQQPALCQAHCQADQQSPDHYQLPELAAASPVPPSAPWHIGLPMAARAPTQVALLQRATAPPLAIRHCCFRI